MEINDDNLREIMDPEYIFLSIRADDSEKNRAIHAAFREMARIEFPKTHDNFTLALGKLLEYYDKDAKTEMLWSAVTNCEHRLDVLEQSLRAPANEDDGGMF